MAFAGMNHTAILLAAIAGWIVGAAWYMTLSRPWAAAQGRTVEEIHGQQKGLGVAAYVPFVVAFIALVVMAWVLAGVVAHLGPGQVTVRNGIISAVFIWGGFVATTMTVNNIFGMRKPMLTVIDGGHWLAVLIVMGAIIGFMGV